jgi:hypothetical protein
LAKVLNKNLAEIDSLEAKEIKGKADA